ncbi:TIGR01777 family protein [Halarcobacter ebronensis]|uniref:TIGR01777 family protein n=1 Tax=Halarcobacter ebronensis TaxID=1462615 RepID=A0A4V1LRY2_9BACT|nr:TIGR01777 family oxidoreductase [Halarcobacter ebronensis]RXJ69788.1 TIGR01777 family protein [Halarcobacter ebronensis]
MKTVSIAGSNGFVGTKLKHFFESLGFKVVGIKREELKDINKLSKIIEDSEIVINLAGANIINRWSESYKKLLYSSRIDTTKALVNAMNTAKQKPKLFISTSAVGIYDNSKCHTEDDAIYAEDFLANVCKDWENEALEAKKIGIRTAIFRFGIVLGEGGGALEKMLLPFKLGVGGTIGNGSQYFSYIHIEDLVNAYKFLYENEQLDGVFNLCAPNGTTNKGLTKALGKALNRPTIFPVPQFVLNLIFSEGAKVLTDGQCAVPKRLVDSGFKFQFNSIETTIKDIVE